MAEECSLSAPLVLKDTQSGFVGVTGNVWTIAPDDDSTRLMLELSDDLKGMTGS